MTRGPIRGVAEALCALNLAGNSAEARRWEYNSDTHQVIGLDGVRHSVPEASKTLQKLYGNGFDGQGIEHALKVILREPCPQCSEPTRPCSTGEPGCLHCDACGWCGS